MAVLALTSASGAPGVTTTALAMTLLWPRPVLLLEADVTGGSAVLAGYLRGAISPHEKSLLGLAAAMREGRPASALWEQTLPLDEAGQRWLLPAIADPVQAPALGPLWAPLAGVLALYDSSGVDVIVDAGRLGAAHGPDPLLQAADAVLVVTRTQLPAVAAARLRAAQLRAPRGEHPGNGPVVDEAVSEHRAGNDGASGRDRDGLGLLLVGEGRPYTRREITSAVGLPVLGSIAWDTTAAEVLAFGTPRPRRWEQSELLASVGAAVTAAQGIMRERWDRAPAGPFDHGDETPPVDATATATANGTGSGGRR